MRARAALRLAGLLLRWTWSGHLLARLRQVASVRRRVLLVARSPLFDAQWYRARYPEVVGGAWHYVRCGAGEHRSPGPWFDGPAYWERNPEVAFAGANPLLDFIRRGAAAGLAASPVRTDARVAQPLNDAGYRRWLDAGHDADAVPGETRTEAAPRIVVPCGTVLRSGAAEAFRVEFARHPDALVVYADSDRVIDGQRSEPWLRGEFDPDLMPDPGKLGAYAIRDRDALERATGEPGRIRHLPAILSHGPHPDPPARVRHLVPDPAPLVTVIIPTRDQAGLLSRCLHGLLRKTDYPALEILIVDNGSRERATLRLFQRLAHHPNVRVLPRSTAFNWSALNNFAASQARGEVLLLLNNDIAVRHSDWLGELVSQACRPDVGVAGAKLLYPDGRVQHAGITLGAHGVASHVMRFAYGNEPGYMNMLDCVRSVAAVTGACAAIRRRVWDEVGGLDESLAVTYNDVDLCLRVRARGYRAVYTPFAELTHREAVTRGFDDTPERQARALAERERFCATWGEQACRDPCISPNLVVLRETLMLAP